MYIWVKHLFKTKTVLILDSIQAFCADNLSEFGD